LNKRYVNSELEKTTPYQTVLITARTSTITMLERHQNVTYIEAKAVNSRSLIKKYNVATIACTKRPSATSASCVALSEHHNRFIAE
jgi:hypothetical protein